MQGRFYFDTSVFGGVFDDEFKKESIQLFEQVKRGRVVCLYSEIVERELLRAPGRVRQHAESLPVKFIERINSNSLVEALAEKYLSEKIIGNSSYEIVFTSHLPVYIKPICSLAGILSTSSIRNA